MSPASELLFVVSAGVAVAGALMTALSRSPLRAAFALLLHIVALAGLFLTLHAEMLAAIQLLVYAGAVVVLFVFVIMMFGAQATVPPSSRALTSRTLAVGAGLMVLASVVGAMWRIEGSWPGLPRGFGSLERVGEAIYRGAALPFEVVSITLLVAIVGAVAVARGRARGDAGGRG